jgi:hypothetical protein
LDETGLNAAVTESMSDLDTFEAAELINTASRVINKIHDARPDLVANLMSGVVDSLRTEDIVKTAEWLVPDLVEALKPLASAVMPVLKWGIFELTGDNGTTGHGNYPGGPKFQGDAESSSGGVR